MCILELEPFARVYLPALIDRTDGKASKGNLLKGRLHLPSIVEMLGKASYSYPISVPHETLLTNNPEGDLVKVPKDCYPHGPTHQLKFKNYFHANANAVLGEYDPSTTWWRNQLRMLDTSQMVRRSLHQ